MSNDMSMDEMIEVLARYRYNAKHDADRIKALEAEASGLRAAVASLERVDNLLIKGLKDELNTLRASSFVTAVPVEEYEKLKAEVAKSEEHNAALCERLQDLNGEVHTASCTNARLHSQFANSEQENARLKSEVERLEKGIQPEGSNDAVGRAVNVLLEKEKEIARLKAEVNALMTNPTSRLLRAKQAENAVLAIENDSLKAEVERLRKAGDEMANKLPEIADTHLSDETWLDMQSRWIAAKEGKPSV